MLRALIIDDIAMIRTSLSRKIEEIGTDVLVMGTASNGKQALDILENDYADICITDVRMPIMDGMELIRTLQQKYAWMSSIVVSNYDDFHYVKQSIQYEAVDFILKPVDIKSMQEALQKASDKIKHQRVQQASEMLLKHMVSHKTLFQRWIQDIVHNRFVSLPVLIMDTLELFEQWTGHRFYLLEELADVWLQWIGEELETQYGNKCILAQGNLIKVSMAATGYQEARRYFRMKAVQLLEERGNALIASFAHRKGEPNKTLSEQIQAYVQQNYRAKLTLDQICEHVAYSKSYVANTFKQETGMTIWEYLNYIRVTEAQKLLYDPGLRINEVAYRIGVSNAVHFNRIFKDYYGVSPMEYRKRILENIV